MNVVQKRDLLFSERREETQREARAPRPLAEGRELRVGHVIYLSLSFGVDLMVTAYPLARTSLPQRCINLGLVDSPSRQSWIQGIAFCCLFPLSHY